jgi:glycosyltransferase involved in cell wall biosynthesis
MITFVVPSIGRPTLKRSLESLINQKNKNWKCIVGFDGISEESVNKDLLLDDLRINYLYFNEKIGQSAEHGNGGMVRNKIMNRIDTEWVGFLDDDDCLYENYIDELLLCNPDDLDCIVFRMRYENNPSLVLPPPGMNIIAQNFVGISFAVRNDFIKNAGIEFINSNSEDFNFLSSIISNNARLKISESVTYLVCN